ncbi:MAG: DUF1972 domain-containing protein [Rikenellaceae bacterium]
MKKVAIIGTVGVPAAYGGFETLVENIIGENCSEGIEYTVFCSSKDCKEQLSSYKGATLKYVSLKANGAQSIPYDIISLIRVIRGYDVVVALGVSGGIFFPIFRLLSRCKFVVNIDGLEWKRAKWSGLIKFYLRLSERLALRCADTVVADNQAIVDYIGARYGDKTVLIAYGSDHVVRDVSPERTTEILESYKLTPKGYAITVCRIEPENNCDMILKAFSQSGEPLVFIGNWIKSAYGQKLKEHYSQFANIKILDAIYDLDILHVLRTSSKYYMHGHSAGGTNPSLVEAMFCGCNIVAYDVVYNRETTEQKASFFKNEAELIELTAGESRDVDNSADMFEIAKRRYTWATIAKQYEALY